MKDRIQQKGTLAVCAVVVIASCGFAQDWPQWRGPNRDGVWRESGILQKLDSPQLNIRWRRAISGVMSRTDRPVSAEMRSMKARVSSATSPGRARSGGRVMATTFRR